MIAMVKSLLAAGVTVKIFSARACEPESIPIIQAWAEKHGLGRLEVTNQKDYDLIRYYDDRAIQMVPNRGKSVGAGYGNGVRGEWSDGVIGIGVVGYPALHYSIHSLTPLAPSSGAAFRGIGANAVREVGPRVLMDIGLDLAPVALVVTDALAPGADRQEPVQHLHLLQCLRHARRNAPQLQQRHDLSRQGLHCGLLLGGECRGRRSMAQSVPKAKPSGLASGNPA